MTGDISRSNIVGRRSTLNVELLKKLADADKSLCKRLQDDKKKKNECFGFQSTQQSHWAWVKGGSAYFLLVRGAEM